MARVNFTTSRIESHKCEEGKDQSFIWDTASPCLGLRATRNGAKAYFFQARLHGKDIRITLGSPSSWLIPDARAEANRLKVLVDQGKDPRRLAAEAKAVSEAEAAVKAARKIVARDAWKAYLAAPHPKWKERHRADHEAAAHEGGTPTKIGKTLTKAAPLASLLARPLHEITAEAVAAWLKKESTTRPTFAKNCLRKFRTFINWCSAHPTYKFSTHSDCCTASAVKDITPSNKTKSDDCLQREQLSLWFAHVGKIGNPVISAYLQVLLLTGARCGELAPLKWDDVSFEWNQMTIRDKIEGKRTIPLTPYVSNLLQALPRINKYVFSSPTAKGGHIVGYQKAHTRAVKEAGLPHLSIHGLRRSFGTLSEWLEIPVGVVAQIEGRKPNAIAEKHYKRRPIDMLRMHHVRIEAWMLEQAGIAFTEKAA